MTDLIKVNQYGDKYFIFDAKDVERLRCEYRIVGALSGTLSQFPLQNTFYGLPLVLLPEEVNLLTSQGCGQIHAKKPRQQQIKDQESKNAIFQYFWSKGFYITSGIKFGGNYLLYKDDPMCTHSEYVVSIRDYEEPILPLEIIGMGRVTTNVKKTFVLASATAAAVSSSERPLLEDTDTEQEEDAQEKMMTYYYSIEWAGF